MAGFIRLRRIYPRQIGESHRDSRFIQTRAQVKPAPHSRRG
ncbi:hypothetical protein D1AOALGA4SA_10534 [Olavius algarvensis Delta 1 endosymbiont]|nr:hypothetical protein D1AOALGA4SA_10534 [Olavius algarvensis Delta 1 endosymbiont]